MICLEVVWLVSSRAGVRTQDCASYSLQLLTIPHREPGHRWVSNAL